MREQLDGRVPKQGLRQPQGAELAEFGEFLQHRINFDGPGVILEGGKLGADGKEQHLLRGVLVIPQRLGLDQRVQRRAGRGGEPDQRLLDEPRFAVPHRRLEQAVEARGQGGSSLRVRKWL